VLRAWLDGAGTRTAATQRGVDRKTARLDVEAAQAAGLERSAGFAGVDDELVGQVVAAVRSARPNGHGQSWGTATGREEQIRAGVDGEGNPPLTMVKIHEFRPGRGAPCPYRTLHRFVIGAATGRGKPRCRWSTGSRGWSARSISATWGGRSIRTPAGSAR
jgi:hypothetical protein